MIPFFLLVIYYLLMQIKTYNFSVNFSCIGPSSGRTNCLTFKGNFVVLMMYMYHLFGFVIASLVFWWYYMSSSFHYMIGTYSGMGIKTKSKTNVPLLYFILLVYQGENISINICRDVAFVNKTESTC